MEQEVIYTLPKNELGALLRQLQSFFPPLSEDEEWMIPNCLKLSYLSVNIISHILKTNTSLQRKEGRRITRFDTYHSIQWMTLLYYLSHGLYLRKSNLCDKVYYLNKIMHSVDLFYAIELPQIWSAEHPLVL